MFSQPKKRKIIPKYRLQTRRLDLQLRYDEFWY